MLQEQQITSFSPNACLHRANLRPYVDQLFLKRFAIVKLSGGSKRVPSRRERMQYDFEARQLWRSVIIESNRL
jgi:hypothetical protein